LSQEEGKDFYSFFEVQSYIYPMNFSTSKIYKAFVPKFIRKKILAKKMRALIRAGWEGRRDRGAEERKALERDGLRVGGLIGIEKLRENPHLEMHVRGG
jgi:hypothetical protein